MINKYPVKKHHILPGKNIGYSEVILHLLLLQTNTVRKETNN